MASSARIEELEKKFTENPRRYFAPLANEYRKAGDLEQAIAICRAYVPQQPAHMSGHVVFGQALFEAGQHDEAQGVLEAALALDPENLIALRHLGDIARARGEVNTARGWYKRVLDADPRNEDVAGLLKSLDASPGVPAAPSPPPLVDTFTNWAEINPERTLELPPGILDSISRDVSTPDMGVIVEVAPSIAVPPAEQGITLEQMLQPQTPAEARPERPDVAMGADVIPEDFESTDRAGAGGAETGRDVDAGSDLSPADGLAGLEVMEFVPPPPSATPPLPDVIDPLLGHPAPNTLPPRPPDPVPVADAADRTAGSEPAPVAFVTETMAELYLQQGFREEALNVYRQLLLQDPRDPTLRERVAQLEREVRPSVTAASTPDTVAETTQQTPEPRHAQTVRDFFGALAIRRLEGLQASAAPGGPEPNGPESGNGPSDGRDGAAASPHSAAAYAPDSVPEARYVVAPGASSPAATQPAVHAEPIPEPPDADSDDDAEVMDEEGAGVDTAEMEALSGFGFGGVAATPRPQAFQYDVSAYDAADMSGGHQALDPVSPPASAQDARAHHQTPPQSPSAGPPVDAGAPVSEPSETPRRPMQTGSVNVLFPGQSIPVPDEAAAATLSNAFGGPTQPGAPAGAAARPAAGELSLDSIFRESPPPVEPRRESSAFSFDQFFGETPARAPASPPPPRDGPAADAQDDDESGDAEHFSNWLSGLKKK